jgi:hypothetical protein
LEKSAYAHKFSCVGVTVAKMGAIEALAGEVTKKKRMSPMLRSMGASKRLGRMRIRPPAGGALMASYSK